LSHLIAEEASARILELLPPCTCLGGKYLTNQ